MDGAKRRRGEGEGGKARRKEDRQQTGGKDAQKPLPISLNTPFAELGELFKTSHDGERALATVVTCGYISTMVDVSIREAKTRLTELARRVEKGETIVVTRNGKPVLDLVPHRRKGGLNLDAIDEFKRKYGIAELVPYIAEDFDAPLPEDFLCPSDD